MSFASGSDGAAAAASSPDAIDHESLLVEFCSLTGMGSASQQHQREFALSFLEGHAWSLERAVHAYLEMKADETAADTTHNEEEVRAPMPDMVDQLYDDSHLFQSRGMMDVLRNGDGGVRSTRASHSAAIGSIDPFRDFASESRTNAALATSATQRRGESLKTANARLSALFKPPDELIYVSEAGDSSFEAASEHALRAKKWLLVNVQQGDEFSSHQLNRDVWNAPAIHQLVQRHFVFCQPNHNSSSGLRYRSLYRPPSIPSVSIIDPITRQKMWDVHAEGGREIRVDKKLIRHIEHTLKEFAAKTDLAVHAPTPNGAAHMDEEQRMMQAAIDASLAQSPAASPSQLAAASSSAASNGRPRNLSSALTGTTKPATGRGRAASSPIQLDDDDDEDEVYVEINDSDGELDAAQIDSDSAYEDDEEVAVLPLAASSNKRKRAAHTTAAETIELDQEETKSNKLPRLSASTVTAAAASPASALPSPPTPAALEPVIAEPALDSDVSLPPEPAAGTPNVCRLQIRLPGGRPAQRRFDKTDPLKHVYAFTRSLLEPEMRSKKFLLVSALPRRELRDVEMSIEDHGVANASVILEWI